MCRRPLLRFSAPAVFLTLLVAAGCQKESNENFGLVREQRRAVLNKIVEPDELVRALQTSGKERDRLLGAHSSEAHATLEVKALESTSDAPTEETLQETFRFLSDGRGAFHLVHDNNREDGIEAIYK